MSKKGRKGSRKKQRTYTPKPGAETAARSGMKNVGKSPSFDPDYSYVIKDLRRIGIIAGSFLVVLIVLAIFLR